MYNNLQHLKAMWMFAKEFSKTFSGPVGVLAGM
jgi:hypothetical protein